MVLYTYDAWGKPISKTGALASTLGTIQPFRYCGYVFDEETELYYLRSRFYNATHGRFLNADAYLKRTHDNPFHYFFLYCFNNPISYFDPSGNTEVHFNVYLKPGNPLDIGHGDISIGDTTYTYGRYDISATWGPMGMMGDGVLEVGPRQLFIYDQLAKGRAVSSFQIDMTDDEVDALQQYFDYFHRYCLGL